MIRRLLFSLILSAVFLTVGQSGWTQGALLPLPEEKPIRGMNTPAVSPDGKTICFSYLGDLWTVPSSGGTAARLTVHEAHDAYPRYSPDGKWVAFSSNREGNYDVFLIPAAGGTVRQITFHTVNDFVQDWTPDGKQVVFYSMRGVDRFQLYSIDITTGVVTTLTRDDHYVRFGSISPDGSSLAYSRSGSVAPWWRPRFHSSAGYDIFVKDLKSGKVRKITDYDGADIWPLWSADSKNIFYVTDKLTPNVPNVVSESASGGKLTLITRFQKDEVRWPAIARNGSLITFVQNGDLWTVKPNGSAPAKVSILAFSDDKTNNLSRINVTNNASEVEVSPDGKTLAIVARGEIWTIPSDRGGDAKRLTNNPANDYDIAWSPDGKSLAFVSDRTGNFDIYTMDVATKAVKRITEDPNDETKTRYSPDGKWLTFLRSGKEGGIYSAPTDGSQPAKRIVESLGNNLEFGVGITSFSYSPDSRWIAFSRRDNIDTADIWIVPALGGTPINVTWFPGENTSPKWTADGKYLLFVSDRDHPNEEGVGEVYSIALNPEKSETDEKKPDATKPDATKPETKSPAVVRIQFDEIETRSVKLTSAGATVFELTPDGKSVIYYSILRRSGIIVSVSDYSRISVTGGDEARFAPNGDPGGEPHFASDINVFYAIGPGGTLKAVRRMGPAVAIQPLAFSARYEFDRRTELKQAFNEFWRRMNVGFYDPNHHGIDWNAMKTKYEPLLSGVATKEEFALFFLSAMVGELNSSHSEISPSGPPPTALPATGELGVVFDETYAGPGLRVTDYQKKGPDDDLGPKVKPGEYIMTIDGEDVQWNEKFWATLFDKAGKTVELLVNSKPSKDSARTVKIKPVRPEQWRTTEHDNWVNQNRVSVEKLSAGRLAYIYVQSMDKTTLKKFEQELWGKGRSKEGIVLDIRGNRGGNTHDEMLAQLSRTVYGLTRPRDSETSTQPFRFLGKPIILLIDQDSVSDGEIFPMGFRNLKLGKIIGVATPGYVIGTYPGRLPDGTNYRIPMWGWFDKDGKSMENNGVKPDITVENTSEDIEAKRDRQLETAVSLIMKDLGKK